jgi:long-chain acyl-CoA synthetase
MLCYTSGTTGNPKAAMISHGNWCSNVHIGSLIDFAFRPDDVVISYLPLAHVFEKMVHSISFCSGSAVGYFGVDIMKLVEDIGVLKPTIIPMVPCLLTRIYDKINSGVNEGGFIKRKLFGWAMGSKQSNLKSSASYTSGVWDTLVFGKTKALLGGRVRTIITGSAPISQEVLTFLKSCFCCPILEGFGMTELSAAGTLTRSYDPEAGHVGCPNPNNEVKLIDIPEMKYFHTNEPNPQGELMFRGDNVF